MLPGEALRLSCSTAAAVALRSLCPGPSPLSTPAPPSWAFWLCWEGNAAVPARAASVLPRAAMGSKFAEPRALGVGEMWLFIFPDWLPCPLGLARTAM